MSHETMNNHSCKMTSLSHWRWSFYESTNEVPSSTIKIASVSLKKEQFSAILLVDKDNQGGNWVCISNKPQLVNQESRKIKMGWWEKNMQLFEWYKEKERSCSMDYKPSLTGMKQWDEHKVQTKCQDPQKKGQKDGMTRGWERIEAVQHMRQDTHE